MGWSIRIARIAGTEVKIHVTFILLLAWIGLMHYRVGGWDAAWQGVLFIVLLFGCVLLHEFGHVFAARRYGIRTPDITLWPIGGVARLQRMPDKPAQELVVAIAGPAVNVVIAAALFLYLGHVTEATEVAQIEDPRIDMLSKLASVNVMLVVFNLIPAFPMDGGRVLRALLAMRLSYARATQIAASCGQAFAFLFGFLGLFFNPMLIFIAIFIYLAASAEARQALLKDISTGLRVDEAMMTQFITLPTEASLDQAVEALLRTTQHEFPVVDSSGELVGILTRDNIIRGLRESNAPASVSDLMHQNIPVVQEDACFDEAFRRMQECECPGLGVVNSGHLIGLITPEAIGEMMMVLSLPPRGTAPAWRQQLPTRT